jgi:hypothetical protein
MAGDNNGPAGDGWNRWAQDVAKALRTLDGRVIELNKQLTDNDKEAAVQIATIKAKAGIVGTIAGIIASAIVSIVVGVLIFQLTKGDIHFDREGVHPEKSSIGYVLPPRENHFDPMHDIISEAKT